ncbi:acid protease [Paxillus ammoniavirescens]|nr:acid protease [Paxillus ammoniavirescens]
MTIIDAHLSSFNGKAKERVPWNARDEGTGGSSGIVLSLDMVSTDYYAVAYTVPVRVGLSQQNLSLQVDTGSSDLWIASQSCSTAPCSATNGRLYDPSSSQPANVPFTITYLSGTVSGPIVWDQVQIGGYTISNQALAAAATVDNEPLSYNFDGILGLALPFNSKIQHDVPASSSNAPDGATFSSNILSLTNAPSQAFFSLTLARPGSSQLPSLLGIGRHPSKIVPDPAKIQYSSLISPSGALFWQTAVRAITVYVNGQARSIGLKSLSGAEYPTALLDSGIPLIITTSEIANGIYGALGVSPGSDGNYYVPCATPLNMTITLDGQPELPIHPLDLTTEPSGQSQSQYCIGLIQTDDQQLIATPDIGDMILGVPFMRNVYTVMAYQQPNEEGIFDTSVDAGMSPTLGLLGLTNATQAMEEFTQVRVLNQPLEGGQSQQSAQSAHSGEKLSIGIEVLIGLAGFFVLCLVLFALRCCFVRRQWRKRPPEAQVEEESEQKVEFGAYQLTRRNSQSSIDGISGATLRELPFDPYMRKQKVSQYTVDSNRTRVEDPGSEFGVRRYKHDDTLTLSDPWNPHAGWRDTIVGTCAGETPTSPYFPPDGSHNMEPGHQHTASELMSVPLLAHRHSDSQMSDPAEFGVGRFVSMAGIGTAARGSIIDANIRHSHSSSDSSGRHPQADSPSGPTIPDSQEPTSPEPLDHTPSDADQTLIS